MNRLPPKRATVRIARMDSTKPRGAAMARAVRFLLAAGLALSVSGAAAAADPPASFPNRPIRMIVPFPAGGPSDIVARLIGHTMSQNWGQPVGIEKRHRANTIIGAQAAAKAAPDGYTLFMAIDSTLVMNHSASNLITLYDQIVRWGIRLGQGTRKVQRWRRLHIISAAANK